MYRGTTPTLNFKLPFSTDSIDILNIAFAQSGKIVMEKELGDCTLDNEYIRIKFSQRDTLKFDAVGDIEIQLRVKTTDGNVLASNIIKTSINRILKDGEL